MVHVGALSVLAFVVDVVTVRDRAIDLLPFKPVQHNQSAALRSGLIKNPDVTIVVPVARS